VHKNRCEQREVSLASESKGDGGGSRWKGRLWGGGETKNENESRPRSKTLARTIPWGAELRGGVQSVTFRVVSKKVSTLLGLIQTQSLDKTSLTLFRARNDLRRSERYPGGVKGGSLEGVRKEQRWMEGDVSILKDSDV